MIKSRSIRAVYHKAKPSEPAEERLQPLNCPHCHGEEINK